MSRHSSRGKEWEAVRAQVLERDSYLCQLNFGGCTTAATEVDHSDPKSLGGSDDPSMLVASCKNCNTRKGNRVIERVSWRNPKYFD